MVAGRLGWRQWHQCECEKSHCLGRLETSPLPAPHNKTACVVYEQGCSPGHHFRPHVTINDQNSTVPSLDSEAHPGPLSLPILNSAFLFLNKLLLLSVHSYSNSSFHKNMEISVDTLWTVIHTCNTINGNSYQGKEKPDPPSPHPPHWGRTLRRVLINQDTAWGAIMEFRQD